MNKPPKTINGFSVVCSTIIDEQHRPTGKCRHIVGGVLQGPVAGLAICHCLEEDSFYLFYCDWDWKPMTDTWHQILEDAMSQAEFEYQGVNGTWEYNYDKSIGN